MFPSFTKLIDMQVLYNYCGFSTNNYVNYCVVTAVHDFIFKKNRKRE